MVSKLVRDYNEWSIVADIGVCLDIFGVLFSLQQAWSMNYGPPKQIHMIRKGSSGNYVCRTQCLILILTEFVKSKSGRVISTCKGVTMLSTHGLYSIMTWETWEHRDAENRPQTFGKSLGWTP